MTTTTTPPAPARRLNHSAVSLWASALVILALVIVQAGRMDPGHMALADVAVNHAETMMLTSDAGGGEDVCIVLDRRAERIYVYALNQRNPELVVSENIADLFTRAAATASTGR